MQHSPLEVFDVYFLCFSYKLIQAYSSLFKLIQAYTSLYKQQAGTVAGRFLQIHFGFMRNGSEIWPDFADLPNVGAIFSSEFGPKFLCRFFCSDSYLPN